MSEPHHPPASFSANLGLMYDAHSHIHLDTSVEGQEAAHQLLTRLKGAALMSMHPRDWDGARALAAEHSGARCLFGVHPWVAHQCVGQDGWRVELRDLVTRVTGAAIGEIGLDRKWVTPDTGVIEYEAQLEVFEAQLELAAELEVPVSVHCVHAQGDLYRILNQASRLPPTIYLHAFGGAVGTVEQLICARRFGARLYFGFAACVNLRSPKTRAVIAAVPRDRLLLESDRASAQPLPRIKAELSQMLEIYTEIKGWASVDEAALCVAENATRFYELAD